MEQHSATSTLSSKTVITGAAGLVGQNLLLFLSESGKHAPVAIDKQRHNLQLARTLNPGLRTVEADLAAPGSWQDTFEHADAAVILHAQITAKDAPAFIRNNVDATRLVLDAIRRHRVPFTILVSSSVVNSVAHDDYVETKKAQERLFLESGVAGCILRPTLMYGWFDPKHLGWLARFMEKTPVFPIPGHGRYMRQPLYSRDFCRIVLWCLEHRPAGKIYDVVGNQRIDYIDMIREIRRAKKLNTAIVKIPYGMFDFLLKLYAVFTHSPPFTSDQLKALAAGDEFTGSDIKETFGFEPTSITDGIEETFSHPVYSKHLVERT